MDVHSEKVEIGGRTFSIETGGVAKQADGSVLVRYGDTMVLVTAVSLDEAREGVDFFPLTVDYRERTAAAGKIPGGFFKREGAPRESETLACRLIDRPIRPLFPKGYSFETQIVNLVMSADKENDPAVLAITGASAALMVSDIPFNGPIAGLRVGRLNEEFVINPPNTMKDELELDVVVAVKEGTIVMVEGEAKGVSEDVMIEALLFAQEQAAPLLEMQKKLQKEAGKEKREFIEPETDEELVSLVSDTIADRLDEALSVQGKLDRYKATKEVLKQVIQELVKKNPDVFEERQKEISDAFDLVKKRLIRKKTIETSIRLDGRKLDEIRPITCKVGFLPRTHGSALFTRGETQACVSCTLGTDRDEQRIDDLTGEWFKRFILHYNFPPFSVGEAKFIRGPGRREIGHGALAERAIKSQVPGEDEFPYTIRIVSDILESNGSSSMATVCGGTMALMDAGVPITEPVSGIAMGLIKEGDKVAILSDILGDEDHLGDMDFKVCGTKKGITAMQMDVKIAGIDKEILKKALEQARQGRDFILGKMLETIAEPRSELSTYAPRITTISVKPERIKDVIGPGGKNIREITSSTGCEIDIDDSGKINIASADRDASQKAIDMIRGLTREAEVGELYNGTVRKITDFGAFVEILPGKDGLLHISQIADKRIEKVTDILHEGDEVLVKVIEIQRDGKIRLSRKEALADKAREEAGKGK
ncbi:MAG: polyribonucleotide nucleotidyltransferase [Deltaproteobacteria bacterium]|nr:polyribonucleotide nucleotidyltransferase [Deltaproteobacteria bacterium]